MCGSPSTAPEKVRQLVRSFNEMTRRLQENESQRRAMQADIAHELRTPLSVIRGTIEGIIDGVYPHDDDHLEPLLEKTAVMTELLEDLQTLSLADAGVLHLHQDQTNVFDLVNGVVAAFRPEAQLRRVELSAGAPPISKWSSTRSASTRCWRIWCATPCHAPEGIHSNRSASV